MQLRERPSGPQPFESVFGSRTKCRRFTSDQIGYPLAPILSRFVQELADLFGSVDEWPLCDWIVEHKAFSFTKGPLPCPQGNTSLQVLPRSQSGVELARSACGAAGVHGVLWPLCTGDEQGSEEYVGHEGMMLHSASKDRKD